MLTVESSHLFGMSRELYSLPLKTGDGRPLPFQYLFEKNWFIRLRFVAGGAGCLNP